VRADGQITEAAEPGEHHTPDTGRGVRCDPRL
jgi:hypothetical protein